jgi:ssDNA-binding replication factor A large subunit
MGLDRQTALDAVARDVEEGRTGGVIGAGVGVFVDAETHGSIFNQRCGTGLFFFSVIIILCNRVCERFVERGRCFVHKKASPFWKEIPFLHNHGMVRTYFRWGNLK